MDNFIARANVDHYLELLSNDGTAADARSVICRLLIEEEDKLSHDLEQLEFAESRTAACRNRVARLQSLRDCLAVGSTDRALAERTLQNHQATLVQLESFCGELRKRASARAL